MNMAKEHKDHESFESCSSEIAITLRQIQISDVDDLTAWASDDRIFQYTRWDAFVSKDQVLDFIKNYAIPHPWFRVICVKNRPVGWVFVGPNSSDVTGIDKCRAEISLVMSFEYWGKGIASKVAKTVSLMVFQEWPHLKRLEAFVYPENKGAQLALEKAGFVREGLMRKYKIKGKIQDLLVFSIVSSQDNLKRDGDVSSSRL